MPLEQIWKPLLRRAVAGRWGRLRMTAREQPPFPDGLKSLGLYLHVPFCRNLCPYCPYNRFPYEETAFQRYERAVHQEIDLYAPHLTKAEFTSLYIGGGTPTVNVASLLRLLKHLRSAFPVSEVCIELHPASMDDTCLAALRAAGVTMVSVGVESTWDHLLARIGRTHDALTAMDALRRAVSAGFDTVNADLMFALPSQTLSEWETDLERVLEAGTSQISTYPLFSFPHSEWGRRDGAAEVRRPAASLMRSMLDRAAEIAPRYGLERCAVWSWLRPGLRKFSSVSRHYYVGFGPGAASMIGSHFYLNTFDAAEYAACLPSQRPIALAMTLDARMEMAYWFYWRLYELFAGHEDFQRLFGSERSLDRAFGPVLLTAVPLGLVKRTRHGYRVTESGAFWIHYLQNEYSLDYIDRVWSLCRRSAWPAEVTL